ncbi:MAG: NAD-dependent epimerase/dehydratase family protein [Anaerolineales bacterium]|jgi:UDP-glucose 4-epimerase
MTSVLVTGGAGFIGSHLVEELLERGQAVRVLDNFSTGRRENLEGLTGVPEVLEGDLRDPDRVKEAIQGVELVFHEAGFVSSPKSLESPQACYANNVSGTENLLEAAREAGVRRVVIASSAAVYGDSQALPLGENTPLRPLTPYAASKQIAEIYAGLYSRSFGTEVVALRYFNVYGPRQSPDSEYAAVVPIFIRRALAGLPIRIEGDGGQTRDLIYVKDVVQANLLASKQPGIAGQTINICTGQETRILDLAHTLLGLFPDSPAMQSAPPRPGDIYRSVGDPGKAAELLGFHAETSLATGLEQTIHWMHA